MNSSNPSSSSNDAIDGNERFMSNFSVSLIHKILLTDPVDFPNLTMNGLPKPKQVYFYKFVKDRHFPLSGDDNNYQHSATNFEEQISKTMYRAYTDMVIKEMEEVETSYKPLQNNILEIHAMLRSLIPNRPDLHSYLKDEDVVNGDFGSFYKVADILIKVGDALCMLESEYRAETTKQWMDILLLAKDRKAYSADEEYFTDQKEASYLPFLNDVKQNVQIAKPSFDVDGDGQDVDQEISMSYTAFALASVTFLHYKAELCQAETADFQLGHILAPRIHQMGKSFIFKKFQEHFGLLDSTQSNGGDNDMESRVSNTKTWLKEMIESSQCTIDELLASEEKRGNVLLQMGWVDNILFRSPRSVNDEGESPQLLLPEVLWLDTAAIRDIRMTTKVAVVGSVLALHAASTAGVSDNAFKIDPLDSIIELCRVNLTAAMRDRKVGSQELYENNIGQAVVDLAKALNPSLAESEVLQSLLNRVKATLRGEDPVIKLLDNRMRGIFRELVVSNPKNNQLVPTSLRTGRSLSLGQRSSDETFNSLFMRAAKKEFIAKGFAFYSSELAEASLLACRTINLVLSIYGNTLLESLFTKELQ